MRERTFVAVDVKFCGLTRPADARLGASLGARFLPFLAITLLILLNSQRVAPEYRNRLGSNVVLAVSVIPFIVVGVQEVLGSL